MQIKRVFRIIREAVIGMWSYVILCTKNYNRKQTALIVEFNAFHGETLPGYVQYLQDLGFYVIVLTRYFVYSDSPFGRLPMKPPHFCMAPWEMRLFLNRCKTQEFGFILYNSAVLYLGDYNFNGRLEIFLKGRISNGSKRFALIEHSLRSDTNLEYFKNLTDESQTKQNLYRNSFVLTQQTFDGHIIPMLNPCFFGTVQKKHKLNTKRIFITIGNVISGNRNFNLLFDTIKKLENTEKFEVWIIGKVFDKEIIKKIPSCVKVLGRLTFAEMYDRLEQADFFLPLLDPQTQPLYLHECTSGSRQLILGFCIPPIIHEVFAEHYGFMPGSCLMYNQKKTFLSAIRQALEMDNEKYENMRLSIEELQKEVRKTSIDNLRKRLVAKEI